MSSGPSYRINEVKHIEEKVQTLRRTSNAALSSSSISSGSASSSQRNFSSSTASKEVRKERIESSNG